MTTERPKRKTNVELLKAIKVKLRKLDLVGYAHLEERLKLLRTFELSVLEKRILAIEEKDAVSRTRLAVDARLGGPQAAQLERKMLVRVLGILHNAPHNGRPT